GRASLARCCVGYLTMDPAVGHPHCTDAKVSRPDVTARLGAARLGKTNFAAKPCVFSFSFFHKRFARMCSRYYRASICTSCAGNARSAPNNDPVFYHQVFASYGYRADSCRHHVKETDGSLPGKGKFHPQTTYVPCLQPRDATAPADIVFWILVNMTARANEILVLWTRFFLTL
nr:hypothetical protein [Candidatus Sigynarchaeota archaeon]